ncbi:MAG: hypothetical protein AABX85_00790 [Nanoarchaeota archaeon]
MRLLRYSQFVSLASTIVKPDMQEEKTLKPLLKVDLQGDIYFYQQSKKITLDRRDRELFTSINEGKFDYHYKTKD